MCVLVGWLVRRPLVWSVGSSFGSLVCWFGCLFVKLLVCVCLLACLFGRLVVFLWLCVCLLV